MADPVVVACAKDAWTKVATNVTTGVVHIKDVGPDAYYQTYRDTAGGAPTNLNDAIPFDTPLAISASAGIDVYIQPAGKAGSVRVDL